MESITVEEVKVAIEERLNSLNSNQRQAESVS
jgi:hypothetical protein